MKSTHHSLLIGLLVVGLAGGAACSATPVNQVVGEYIGGGLELAVTPTPQHAALADDMIEVATIQLHMPDGDYGAPTTIIGQIEQLLGKAAGRPATRILIGDEKRNARTAAVIGKLKFPADVSGRGDEAYRLYVGADPAGAGGLIVLAGNSPQGDFWAMQSLRQLTAFKDGRTYVRRGAISDWPTFPKRGNKRPRTWEHRYKANYSWTYQGARPEFRDVFRNKGAFVRNIRPLGVADADWMRQLADQARKAYDSGVREFVIKYDDQPMAMTPATRKKFNDNYYAAQVAFMREVVKMVKAWDPSNVVFFMLQPYWTNATDIIEYGRGLKAAGGIPPEIGMSFCGQQTVSTSIPLGCVTKAEQALGFSGRQKAQIYDNHPRGGDLWAYHARDRRLPEKVECIFPERGTPVTRITVYDYLWNPAAYDPTRSLKLSCRELSGGDPRAYRALYDYVTTWNKHRDSSAFMPTAEARKHHLESTRMLRRKYEAAKGLLRRGELARQCDLATVLLHGENWGETAALEDREKFAEALAAHGYKTGVARRRSGPIRIDGKLDEPAWKKARPLDKWVGFKQLPNEKNPAAPLLPSDRQSEGRILWDDDYLYVGVALHHTKPVKFPNWSKDRKVGRRAHLAWRVPCIEICIDPNMDRNDYFQIIPNLQGWYCETNFLGFGSAVATGAWWKSGIEFKAHVGKSTSFIEARIPLANLGGAPKRGDRWGLQLCRGKLDGYSTWSYMYEFAGFRFPKHFGTLVFE